ncbi:MAG: hypothetical protein ACFFDM_12180 [Candidatus Thorarchaeota archaeon]
MWIEDLEKGLMYSAVLMVINLGVGFAVTLVLQEPLMYFIASGLAFIEIALLLILGGCLMARQPLDDRNRYDSDGNFTKEYKMFRLGRQFLLASVLLFLYMIVLGPISLYLVF